ncbi:hypothetical protein ACH50O_20260 [Methylomonas sp. 2BW1-5-20]|uniref:hypothetical protein n=1 Tax=Methylomonas sp. 2BW1-5-20 TaxID=3376686 RepID=UPI004052C00D
MWTTLLFTCTACIFLLPLLPAIIELRLKEDIEPVAVDQANAGNIDYFAESFLAFITDAINDYQSGKTEQFSQQNYCLYQQDAVFTASAEELKRAGTDRLVVGLGDLRLPPDFNFTQEVFSKGNINCGEKVRLRSALAIGDLQLGKNSQLLRWAHACNIFVASGCVLLGRVSAEADLNLLPHCEFVRVNANRIYVMPKHGEPAYEQPVPVDAPKIEVNQLKTYLDNAGRVLLDGNLDFPANGVWQGDMVIRGDAVIREDAEIAGSLKVYGDIHIESGVTITGAIVCNKKLNVASRCVLNGPLVAEKQIELDSGCRIGNPLAPSSVTAPVIRIAMGVTVHGTLWARNRGEVLAALTDGKHKRNSRISRLT